MQAPRSKFKISLTAVLNDEVEYPFSLENFEKFVHKEHSEENLEFFHALTRYRESAAKHYPNCISNLRQRRPGSHSSMRSISSAFASSSSLGNSRSMPTASEEMLAEKSDDKAGREKLKDEVELIVTLYMIPGSDKEVNLPSSVRKKVLTEVNEKKNYHPDVFKHALEHVYLMMKTSTYPNFYREAVAYLKEKNLPMPRIEREGSTERRTLDRSRGNLSASARDAKVAQ
ncbi:RGS domain-containing protein [Powellomyces hirtus]|nr:RGS domain-containing protein [Powellomyces hirtus]